MTETRKLSATATDKRDYVAEATNVAVLKVATTKVKIACLHYALEDFRETRFYPEANKDFSAAHSALFRELNDAYRQLLMWGYLRDKKDETIRAAIKEAVEHFLGRRMAIMDYLSFGPAGAWPTKDEDEFRRQIAERAAGI